MEVIPFPADGKPVKCGILNRDCGSIPEDVVMLRDAATNVIRMRFPVTDEAARVPQPYGMEQLSHDSGSIRMARIVSKSAPLLFNHSWGDIVGMVDGGEIINRRLFVDVHFFDTPRAREVIQMVNGGLRNVSAGYRLHKIQEDPSNRGYVATEWEPLEVSIVTVPADPTVGLGRMDLGENEVTVVRSEPQTITTPQETLKMDQPAAAQTGAQPQQPPAAPSVPATPVNRGFDPQQPPQGMTSGVDLEKARRATIENLCKMNKLPDQYRDHYIGTGMDIQAISDDILMVLEERGKTNPQPASKLGLTTKETQTYSIRKAILACIDKDWSNAGFELDCSRAIAKEMNKPTSPQKFYVPFEALQRSVSLPDERAMFYEMARRSMMGKRDLTVASAGGGGYLVATDNVGFIEMLRNRAVVFRMGARRLSGLQGNVTIPRQSAAATAYWLANEATQITESQQTFVQVALTPKTAGAYTELSRLLLLQSNPSAEGIVTDDLAQVVALAVDLAVLNGSGSGGQPQGIIGTSGLGAVSGTSMTFPGILEFQTDVAGANVTPQQGGYVTTALMAAKYIAMVKYSSTASPIWEGNVWDGAMQGFPAMTSNQMPASSMLFGDWQECVVGEWGVLEVEVNPFANFQAGIIGVRAMYSMDTALRRPFAFSYASSIT